MELEILKSIQSIANPFFDVLFELITMCGEQVVLIAIMAIIYWTYDKKFGEYMAYSVLTTVLLNNAMKDIFKMKRPIGEDGIRSLRTETATGYSFPSGHTQGSAAFYSSIAIYLKKRWLYILMAIIIILIGFSRLYLGVHYPKDVIVGGILGVLTSVVCYKLYNKFDNKLMLYGITFIIFVPALLFARSPDFVKGLGSYLGFFLGMLVEKKYVNFTLDIPKSKKVLRVVVGVIILAALQYGLKAVFPSGLVFSFIRYTCITFIGLGVYPVIFTIFKF